MPYRLMAVRDKSPVMVVGCGGTGGFVAEGLCRLFHGKENAIYLVDHDRVEERNVGRQNFYPGDVGKFKSRVLAERLAEQFRREVNYITEPVEEMAVNDRATVTIGCVDNAAARERLQWAGFGFLCGKVTYCKWDYQGWYIDAGNGEYSGQVLIGNALGKECKKSFLPKGGIVERLPLPQVQQPGLLVPETKPRDDCARAVEREEQSPVINRMMADLVLTFVHRLFRGELQWMAGYVDLEAGSVRCIDAEPETVSRITGYTVRELEYRPRETKVGNHNKPGIS